MPPSAAVAGAFARADTAAGVGQPPAGDYGVLTGFTPTRSWTDAERAELNDGRVNVICRSGGRSAQVAMYLVQQGVDAVNVDGGMQVWAASGRPVVTDEGKTGFVL